MQISIFNKIMILYLFLYLCLVLESGRGNPLSKNYSEKEIEATMKISLRGPATDGGRNLRR